MKLIASLFTAYVLLMLPMDVLAHPGHGPNTPDHPTGSPHAEQSEEQSISDSENALVAALMQLLELLRTQLAILLGQEPVVDPSVDDMAICTEDAFMCPDGSWIGRSGTDCEFVCPAGDTAEAIETTGDLVMTADDSYRYFTASGLPEFSISSGSYRNSPSAQDHDFRVPLNPERNDEPTYYNIPFTFGIALNGVTFEPFAAEWYQDDRNSGWQEDPFVTLPDLDQYNAHVQPNGLYHYHGIPTNLLDGDGRTHSSVIGFASDGFPLYGPWVHQDADDASSELTRIDSSYQLRSGIRPDGPGGRFDGTYNEDYEYSAWGENSLDECNGRFGITPEYPEGTYYYVATESFPYIPRCLMGDQDPSFIARTGAGPR